MRSPSGSENRIANRPGGDRYSTPVVVSVPIMGLTSVWENSARSVRISR